MITKKTKYPTKKFLLKDILFNKEKVEKISKEIHLVFPSFKEKDFRKDVIAKFPKLELKERISWMAECLKKYLPGNYRRAVGILVRALPKANNPELLDGDFGDFIYAPYAEFIAKNGCTKEDLSFSLEALREITQRFSAEDAIRSFINAFPDETLKEMLKWTKDAHYHVRRLCSEGTRPKLPWSQKINLPIFAALPILDNLFFDNTRYVTRSVANHMNDISKSEPVLVLDTLKKWKDSKKQQGKEMDYIVNHALRTLIKKGNPQAMKMLGLNHVPRVRVSGFNVPTQVRMNSPLEFSFTISAEENENIVIDYAIYFQNKSGKLNSKKVFKLKKLTLAKGASLVVQKRHMLRERMTTRTLYAGEHEIEIQINGKKFLRKTFLISYG